MKPLHLAGVLAVLSLLAWTHGTTADASSCFAQSDGHDESSCVFACTAGDTIFASGTGDGSDVLFTVTAQCGQAGAACGPTATFCGGWSPTPARVDDTNGRCHSFTAYQIYCSG
jgi:hypothetical protein